jgi:hypothetical protein
MALTCLILKYKLENANVISKIVVATKYLIHLLLAPSSQYCNTRTDGWMASPLQPLHNHTGLQESEGEGDSKSILQKIIPKRFTSKKQSLKSVDGSDQLSRSPSPDSKPPSRASLGVRDSVGLLPHMYNTNSFERFATGSGANSAEDPNMSTPSIKTIRTLHKAF